MLSALVMTMLVSGGGFGGCLVVGCAASGGTRSTPGGHTTAHDVLTAQQAALLGGNEDAFLSDVDPRGPSLVRRFRDLFDTLRALQVSRFVVTGDGTLEREALPAQTISVPVTFRYCVAEPGCTLDPSRDGGPPKAQLIMRFLARDGRLWISDLTPAPGEEIAPPPPWLTERLVTRAGRRVVVAASPSLEGRLPATLAVAEQAASVADRFARYTEVPGRYVVFLADARQFATWYGGPSGGLGRYGLDAVGFTHAVSRRYSHVVINGSVRTAPAQLAELLRHEFGHVVTESDADTPHGDGVSDDQAWMSEGAAAYVAVIGTDPLAGGRLADLRRYLPRGRNLTVGQLLPPKDRRAAAGFTAASLVAIQYLAQRYGETAMLRFVDAAIRHGQIPERICPEVFGKAWVAVGAELAAAVNSAAVGPPAGGAAAPIS